MRSSTYMRPGRVHSVEYTGTAGTTSQGVSSNRIRVVCTSAAFIAIGADPTATDAGVYLPADSVEYFSCDGGAKVSAVQVSSGGTLYVTEMH